MSKIIDYVWVNEEYLLVTESIESDLADIHPYCFDNIMIKPNQIFRNPFKSQNDLIALCDMYYINYYTEPHEIILAEHNQRKQFDQYMSNYSGEIFQINQKYNCSEALFRSHKDMCKYIGIDVFGKPCEYSIYTQRKNVYNYVWMSRYILYQLANEDIEWTELNLISSSEDDICENIQQLEVCSIDELFNSMNF